MFNRIPTVTKNLLIINALFFLGKWVAQIRFNLDLDVYLGAFYPESANFELWQIITHMFMHGDITHFGFNMFALWMFGSVVEQTLGEKRFLILYFAAGLGAFALFNGVNYFNVHQRLSDFGVTESTEIHRLLKELPPGQGYKDYLTLSRIFSTPMVGASGAIYGLLVAFGVWYPNQKLMLLFPPIPIKAKYFIPILILVELYLGIQNYAWNPIAHFAHLGGALIGFLLVRHWKKNQFRTL